DERELTVVRAQPLHPADENAERRRVDERRVREVDDHLLPTLADDLEQLLLELGRGVEVDLARERDHVYVVRELLRLDVEVQIRPPSSIPAAGVYPEAAGASCLSCSLTAPASGSSGASLRKRL